MHKNINYLEKIVASNFMRLKFPHKISYILTYKCNLRCQMCNVWKKDDVDELDCEEIERFFRASNSFSWIGITGGEVFLRKDIKDVVKIIISNCKELVAVHFASNGTMTDEIISSVEEIIKYSRHIKLFFTLSIDGPPELHDKIRGVSGTWMRCMNTFKNLQQFKTVKPRIGFTLSHNNLGRFSDTFASLKEAQPSLRFDDITVNVFNKSSFYYENIDLPALDNRQVLKTINDILVMDKDCLTINNFLRRKYLSLYKRYLQFNKCPLKCQALSSTCIMDPNGNIFPCSVYGVKIANVKEYGYDLEKIWSSDLAKEIKYRCMNNQCPSCWSPCDAYSTISGSLLDFNLWRKIRC